MRMAGRQTALIQDCPLEFIGAVNKKEDLRKRYTIPDNPYEIAMLFCIEEALVLLKRNGQTGKTTHLVIEGRGAKENNKWPHVMSTSPRDHQGTWFDYKYM